jgi:predicted  nucleic acid-binding Zn-ribbon protein
VHSNNNPHNRKFRELLALIKEEVDGLKSQINDLEDKNANLEAELRKTKEHQDDAFSSMKETERMALKHQVKGLIAKINEHLDEPS